MRVRVLQRWVLRRVRARGLREAVVIRAVLYARVSTREQAENGGGLDAQMAVLRARAECAGWTVVAECIDRGVSGASLDRPEVRRSLGMLATGDADLLCVSRVDRLSRSLVDFAGLLERARREGWAVAALDLGVDTSTATGELVAHVLGAVAQWERRMIGERTRDGMAAKKAAGTLRGPVGRVAGDPRNTGRAARA